MQFVTIAWQGKEDFDIIGEAVKRIEERHRQILAAVPALHPAIAAAENPQLAAVLPPSPATAPAVASAPAETKSLKDVTAALRSYVEKNGLDKATALLNAHFGVKRVAEIPASRYAELFSAFYAGPSDSPVVM